MSFVSQLNGTSFPTSNEWSGYLAHAQAHLHNNPRLVILFLINTPIIVIILNILQQLVRGLYCCGIYLLLIFRKVIPRKVSEPPTVFHWLPFFGSAASYGNDPLNFFFECQKKVSNPRTLSIILNTHAAQYGDVFTFILFGRRVTVALGPKGNNFILGGKSTVFNAEDAYTVCRSLSAITQTLTRFL